VESVRRGLSGEVQEVGERGDSQDSENKVFTRELELRGAERVVSHE